MIKAIIIEDSQSALDLLKGLLESYLPQVKLLGNASDVSSGIKLIQDSKPNLVFLDIELKDKSGFDLLNEIGEKYFEVVFITGFDNFAIEAFQHNALHYLIKPVGAKELVEAVNRVHIKLEKNSGKPYSNEDLDFRTLGEKKISIKTESEIKLVYLKDIIHIKSDGSYSIFHLINGKRIIVSKLLKEVEKQLGSEGFYRLSKSNVINLQHISSVKHVDGGQVEMIDGTVIPIPRRKRDDFAIVLSKFTL